MVAARSAEPAPTPTIRTDSAKTLREWCSPEVIFVITNLADETMILSYAIQQARQSRGKIVLAHVFTPREAASVSHNPLLPRPVSGLKEARSIIDRIAR